VFRTALASCACLLGAAVAARAAGAPVLTMDGFGPMRIGMTRAQVEAAGERLSPDDLYGPDHPEYCWQAAVVGRTGVRVMFSDNRLVRISLRSDDFATRSGARTGMSEAQVQAIYGGRLRVETHFYDPTGHYLKLFSADGSRALVMETDGTTVDEIRAGDADAAQAVEGCL
jgi:hypothetical protein